MPSQAIGAAARQLVQDDIRAISDALALSSDIHVDVHSARKGIRHLRAVLALSATGEQPLDGADRALRQLGRSLSVLRDAHVLVEVAETLASETASPAWKAVVMQLVDRRERILQRVLLRDPGLQKKQRIVQRIEAGLEAHGWEAIRKADLRRALVRSERRVKKAAARARDSNAPEALHEWRRRVRRLRMQLEALARLDAGLVAHHPGVADRTHAKGLRKLSDALGREQDLRLLRNQVRAMRGIEGKAGLMAQLR